VTTSTLRMLACAATVIAAAPATAATLYDPALGSMPFAQGWTPGPSTIGVVQGVSGGLYSLDTTASVLTQYGWARIGNVSLDTATGFDLGFTLRVASESHLNTNRAGFTLMVNGADPTREIEFGFWTDRIFAYDYSGGSFVHGADVAFDTTGLTTYTLSVRSQTFSLRSGATTLLSGSLRDYTSYTGLGHEFYQAANFIFVGDNTSSAAAAVQLGAVTLTPVPEPATATLLTAGLALVARRRR